MKPKHRFFEIDICVSDYFNGYHKPVLQVPVWADVTKEELTEMVISEYNDVYDHLSYENAWPDLSTKELRAILDAFIMTDLPLEGCSIPKMADIAEDADTIYLFIGCEEK